MQLDLGFDEDLGTRPVRHAAQRGDNWLFGIMLDERPDAKAKEIADNTKSRLGLTDISRPFHVSLIGLGRHREFPGTSLLHIKDNLSNFQFPAFRVHFDEMMSFKTDGKLPIILCCSQRNQALFDLQNSILAALEQPGIEVLHKQKFNPHITLFYSRRTIARHQIDVPLSWTVRKFWLIRSFWGETRHHGECSWPLSP